MMEESQLTKAYEELGRAQQQEKDLIWGQLHSMTRDLERIMKSEIWSCGREESRGMLSVAYDAIMRIWQNLESENVIKSVIEGE